MMIGRLRESLTLWVQGGLGNQLFQWNAGLHAAGRINAPLLLSPASFRRDPLREIELRTLLHNQDLTTLIEDLAIGRPFARSGELKTKSGPFGLSIVESPQLVQEVGTLLLGFFQTEDDLAIPTGQVVTKMQARSSELRDTPLGKKVEGRIGVHVRRGDYVTAPGALRAFGTISERYYLDSLDSLGASVQDAIFFSDDPDYVVRTFGVKREHVVGPSDTDTDLESMLVMSLSRGLIIPNSTFSWWAAEAMGPDALVVSPTRWFVDERIDQKVGRSYWRHVDN